MGKREGAQIHKIVDAAMVAFAIIFGVIIFNNYDPVPLRQIEINEVPGVYTANNTNLVDKITIAKDGVYDLEFRCSGMPITTSRGTWKLNRHPKYKNLEISFSGMSLGRKFCAAGPSDSMLNSWPVPRNNSITILDVDRDRAGDIYISLHPDTDDMYIKIK